MRKKEEQTEQIMEVICDNCKRTSLCLTLEHKESHCRTCDIKEKIERIIGGEKND